MAITVKKHRPQLRCYKCNDPVVSRICCKCLKGICETHQPLFRDTPFTYLFGKVADRFFRNRAWPERLVFCRSCLNDLSRERSWLEAPLPLLIMLVILVFSFLIIENVFVKWMLAFFLIAVFIWGGRMLFLWTRWVSSLPVILSPPNIESLKIAESLSGNFRFNDEGKGEKTVASITGKLNISTRFIDIHQKEIKGYCTRYWYRPRGSFIIHIGHALIRGTALIRNDSDLFASEDHYFIPMKDELSNRTFLLEEDGTGDPRWNLEFSYGIEKAELPVSVIPSFPMGMGQNTLKLSFFLQSPMDAGEPGSFEIDIPSQYGIVDECIPPVFTIDRTNPESQKIVWFKPYGALEHPAKDLFTLTVRFEKNILEGMESKVRRTDTLLPITGKIGFPLKGAVSGIKEVFLFNAAGRRFAENISPSLGTSVSCDFEISLKSLRYDEKKKILPLPPSGPHTKLYLTQAFEDVVPSPDTIIDLTNALEEKGFYIKHIVETSNLGDQNDEYLRYWNIYGRRYDHLYPVSFQMVVSGREIESGYVETSSGNSNLSLKIEGLYAGEKMEEVIYGVWQDLIKISQSVLRRQ